jgi:hypothetical protein
MHRLNNIGIHSLHQVLLPDATHLIMMFTFLPIAYINTAKQNIPTFACLTTLISLVLVKSPKARCAGAWVGRLMLTFCFFSSMKQQGHER